MVRDSRNTSGTGPVLDCHFSSPELGPEPNRSGTNRFWSVDPCWDENLTWFFGGWSRSFGFDITNRRFEINIHITLDNIYSIARLFILSITRIVPYRTPQRDQGDVNGLIMVLCFDNLEFIFFPEIINTDHIIFGKTSE